MGGGTGRNGADEDGFMPKGVGGGNLQKGAEVWIRKRAVGAAGRGVVKQEM